MPRTLLVEQLCATVDRVVAILAPAGYGKTTLLTEWASLDPRSFAWVALDDLDNDPSRLLEHVVRELDQARPDRPPLLSRIARPRVSILASALPLITHSFLHETVQPLVLVVDDIHLVHNVAALDALTALAEHLPPGSVIAVAGRGDHGFPLARLRARGRLVELGHQELRLDATQAETLVRSLAGDVSEEAALHLVDRTEGWPVGLYLGGLALAADRSAETYHGLGGDDHYVRDYVRTDILALLPEAERSLLIRTSILPTLSGDLCDAALQRSGSQALLESIERGNHLLVPLDRRRRWFRCHELFREALEAELTATEPELVAGLRQAAIAWFTANDQPERAFEQAVAMGDVEQARQLMEGLVLPVFHQGRIDMLVSWIDRFGDALAQQHQTLATVSSWAGMVTGNPVRAERWALAAGRAYERNLAAGAVPTSIPYFTWRAHLAPEGAATMLADAERALEEVPEFDDWRGPALLVHGVSLALNGRSSAAHDSLEAAVEVGLGGGALMAATMALSWQSSLAMAREDWASAEQFCARSADLLSRGQFEEYPFSGISCAVSARCAARKGDRAAAEHQMVKTQRVLPLLTRALPWLAIQTRVELGRAQLAMGEVSGCRVLLLELDELLRRVPDPGRLADEVESLRTGVEVLGGRTNPGGSSLTTAELRLVPYLSTHLTFREIGERLFVSENTVKSHAGSIYRKLGAASRSEAVDVLTMLGLVGS